MDPFLYAFTGVIAFYAAALAVLVDAFLRFEKPRSMKIFMRRLEVVLLFIALDLIANITKLVILTNNNLKSHMLSFKLLRCILRFVSYARIRSSVSDGKS